MQIYEATPLVESIPLSSRCQLPVWLKMESAQPCGSFKLRGMGLAAQRAVAAGATRLISSSGGNAGYAVAWAGRALGVEVTVVVPSTTNARMRNLIQETGAEVRVAGTVWDEAHAVALSLAEKTAGVVLHPFDHPDIWEGHSTLIHEVSQTGLKPGLVVVAVGGGGLFTGVVQGMQAVGWSEVPVLAVETNGAASFAAALTAQQLISIDKIETVALTLGARQVCQQAFEWAQKHPTQSVVVNDDAAIRACSYFLDDHRTLVEPSCGAALSIVYDVHSVITEAKGPVLLIVCGGAAVTHEQLSAWL